MKPKMRRNLSGQFVTRRQGAGTGTGAGAGAWRLSRSKPSEVDIFLRGAGFSDEVFASATVSDVDIEWGSDMVTLRLTSAARPLAVEMQSAIVHEPQLRLYDALGLPSFDDGAQRFWRRVFRLVRIPGGRHLLRLLARRSRQSR